MTGYEPAALIHRAAAQSRIGVPQIIKVGTETNGWGQESGRWLPRCELAR